MSRQYDEVHGDDLEINGETLRVIEPNTFEEFLEAVQVKDKLAYAANTVPNDEDSGPVYDLLEEQEQYVREYIENLGTFDNSILVANIDFLCRKYGIRVGELERYAGISAGYISRTAKENSQKRMSIDIVWKLAKLFDLSVQDLIGSRMEDIKGNSALLLKFLDKLIAQTESGEHEWESAGGVMCYLEDRLANVGLFEQTENGCIYHPEHLNDKMRWVLTDDIMICPEFMEEDEGELMIIPFTKEGSQETQYDIMMLYDFTNLPGYQDSALTWEKVLYTHDDPWARLTGKAAKLYETIKDMEFDAKLSSNIRGIVKDYLAKKN